MTTKEQATYSAGWIIEHDTAHVSRTREWFSGEPFAWTVSGDPDCEQIICVGDEAIIAYAESKGMVLPQ